MAGRHRQIEDIQIGRGGDERRFEETLEDHALLTLLNGRANPMESGDVFIEKTYSRGGTLTRLDVLPPDRWGTGRRRLPPNDQRQSLFRNETVTGLGHDWVAVHRAVAGRIHVSRSLPGA